MLIKLRDGSSIFFGLISKFSLFSLMSLSNTMSLGPKFSALGTTVRLDGSAGLTGLAGCCLGESPADESGIFVVPEFELGLGISRWSLRSELFRVCTTRGIEYVR